MLVKGMILDSFESSMAIESDTANIIMTWNVFLSAVVPLFLDIVQLYASQ